MTTEITSIDAPDGIGYELRIDAPPETVWRFWVEPERMVRWMGKVATLEPRPGGAFRIDYGQGDVIAGAYIELDEPRRLTVRWAWESADPVEAAPSRIEIELDAIDGGAATLLRFGISSSRSHRGSAMTRAGATSSPDSSTPSQASPSRPLDSLLRHTI